MYKCVFDSIFQPYLLLPRAHSLHVRSEHSVRFVCVAFVSSFLCFVYFFLLSFFSSVFFFIFVGSPSFRRYRALLCHTKESYLDSMCVGTPFWEMYRSMRFIRIARLDPHAFYRSYNIVCVPPHSYSIYCTLKEVYRRV